MGGFDDARDKRRVERAINLDLDIAQIRVTIDVFLRLFGRIGVKAGRSLKWPASIDKTGLPLQEQGGVSGRPLTSRSTEIIRLLHRLTGGRVPIIGVGGIFNASDAREKLEAGASLLQLYTGFVYEGPCVVRKICEGLL